MSNPVCVSLFDKKATAFLAPYFYTDLATAERAFVALLQEGTSTPAQWPDDFDLYHLGSIDPVSGALVSLDHPVCVLTGQSGMIMASRLRRGGSELSRGGKVFPPSEDSGASAERNGSLKITGICAYNDTPDLFGTPSPSVNNNSEANPAVEAVQPEAK